MIGCDLEDIFEATNEHIKYFKSLKKLNFRSKSLYDSRE